VGDASIFGLVRVRETRGNIFEESSVELNSVPVLNVGRVKIGNGNVIMRSATDDPRSDPVEKTLKKSIFTDPYPPFFRCQRPWSAAATMRSGSVAVAHSLLDGDCLALLQGCVIPALQQAPQPPDRWRLMFQVDS
jgi:hypothetical protein